MSFNGARPEGQDQTGIARAQRAGGVGLQWGPARRPGSDGNGCQRPAVWVPLQWGPARRPGSDRFGRRKRLPPAGRLQWGPARRPGSDSAAAGRSGPLTIALQWGPARRPGSDSRYLDLKLEAYFRLQWGPARRPGSDPPPAGATAPSATCFNGARPEGQDQTPAPSGPPAHELHASMGPGPKARIRLWFLLLRNRRGSGFNGARPEGQDQTPRGVMTSTTTIIQLQWGPARRPGSDGDNVSVWSEVEVAVLQWGPARRPGSDTPALVLVAVVQRDASMGPGPKARIRPAAR